MVYVCIGGILYIIYIYRVYICIGGILYIIYIYRVYTYMYRRYTIHNIHIWYMYA